MVTDFRRKQIQFALLMENPFGRKMAGFGPPTRARLDGLKICTYLCAGVFFFVDNDVQYALPRSCGGFEVNVVLCSGFETLKIFIDGGDLLNAFFLGGQSEMTPGKEKASLGGCCR